MNKIENAVSKYKEIRNNGGNVQNFNNTEEAKSLNENEQILFLMKIALWRIEK